MSAPADSRAGSLLREQGGFTVVEAMIAAMIMIIGVLGTLQVVDASTRNAYRAEESQVAINRIQLELEVIRRLPYEQIALSTTAPPASDPNENHPYHRISSSQFALARDGTNLAPLVYNGSALEEGGTVSGGAIAPSSTFTSGDVSGTVYRFVVWRNDFACSEARCPGSQDVKRVVVAVKLDTSGVSFERSYQELQSDFIDPGAHQQVQPTPEVPDPVEAEQFWLSDTTCENAAPQPPSSHATHNTLGSCDDLVQSGATPGAPDLLLNEKGPELVPFSLDFATDLEPTGDPATDRGLQLRAQSDPGCDYTPAGENPQHRLHVWLTEPLPQLYSLEGEATLTVFTQTMPGVASHPATVCAYLFRREPGALSEVDHLIADANQPANPYFTRSAAWPSSSWEEVEVPMSFAQTNVQAGERLGIAISVERAGTGPDLALQLAYDEVSLDSRVEVETSTPLG